MPSSERVEPERESAATLVRAVSFTHPHSSCRFRQSVCDLDAPSVCSVEIVPKQRFRAKPLRCRVLVTWVFVRQGFPPPPEQRWLVPVRLLVEKHGCMIRPFGKSRNLNSPEPSAWHQSPASGCPGPSRLLAGRTPRQLPPDQRYRNQAGLVEFREHVLELKSLPSCFERSSHNCSMRYFPVM